MDKRPAYGGMLTPGHIGPASYEWHPGSPDGSPGRGAACGGADAAPVRAAGGRGPERRLQDVGRCVSRSLSGRAAPGGESQAVLVSLARLRQHPGHLGRPHPP